MNQFLLLALLKIVVVMFILLTALAYTVWLERKVAAHIQGRWGPYLVGPFGLLQPLADLVKFIFKEDPTPAQADRPVYYLAPFLALALALMSIAVIPFGPTVNVAGRPIALQITDLNIGSLYCLEFLMAHEAGFSGPQTITVSIDGGPGINFTSLSADTTPYWNTWENKSLFFTATGTTASLSFSATTSFDIGLDNVRISAPVL